LVPILGFQRATPRKLEFPESEGDGRGGSD